ncbi:endogenous inhibitor of DNA gyrase (YacG/DUF329 family) [Marinobacter sp. MBR-99]
MSICSKCGNPVEFRYVNGRCIPMHFEGGCIGSSSSVNDFSGYNTATESTCFSTTCPECGDEVFFIRHNGGSVWLDPPLGWPWYKHGCFYPEEKTAEFNDSALVTDKIALELAEGSSLEIGIAKRTYVEANRNYTDIVLESAELEPTEIRVKNNAGFLLGKLCVLDRSEETIWPFYEPDYLFWLYDAEKFGYKVPPKKIQPPKKSDHKKLKKREVVKCGVCGCTVSKKKLRRHMRKVHQDTPK